jgi:hypothetical protein
VCDGIPVPGTVECDKLRDKATSAVSLISEGPTARVQKSDVSLNGESVRATALVTVRLERGIRRDQKLHVGASSDLSFAHVTALSVLANLIAVGVGATVAFKLDSEIP